MFRSLRLNRSVAAVGLFAVCVLLVVGVRQMARVIVHSSPAVPDSLTVSVRSGARGMRVRIDARAHGFSRAFHMTAIRCRDAAGRWQSATFR